jgi:hypothetical protein
MEDARILVALFPTPSGYDAAALLTRSPDKLRALMPQIVRVFHDSMAVRIRGVIRWPAIPEGEPEATRAKRAAYARRASLKAFLAAGDDAYAAADDVLELVRRHVCYDEYVGSEAAYYDVVAAVLGERPDPLLRDVHFAKWIAIEEMRIMGQMEGVAKEIGPALIDKLADPDDDIVDAAAQTMCFVDWSREDAVEKLEARLASVKKTQTRDRIAESLAGLKSILARQRGSSSGTGHANDQAGAVSPGTKDGR